MLNTVTTLHDWFQLRKEWQASGQTIGFVPTMGNLHEGHLSLCRRSLAENDKTIVSIFVNPAQFNQKEDFDRYPRTLAADQALLSEISVDCLLVPDASEMYADQYEMKVIETSLSQPLEGEYRPGHFDGMLTVVMKLLNIVQPARIYMGEKDYQQYLLVDKMAKSLFMPVDVVPCETIRNAEGLALSSRNNRLSATQLERVLIFSKALASNLSVEAIRQQLENAGFQVDYIAEKWGRRLGAVWMDGVRLIDNVALEKGI